MLSRKLPAKVSSTPEAPKQRVFAEEKDQQLQTQLYMLDGATGADGPGGLPQTAGGG